MAVPSMLMVLPSGMEKLETLREAPSFCTLVRLVDRAAALEQVVKLVSSGALRPRKKVPGLRPA